MYSNKHGQHPNPNNTYMIGRWNIHTPRQTLVESLHKEIENEWLQDSHQDGANNNPTTTTPIPPPKHTRLDNPHQHTNNNNLQHPTRHRHTHKQSKKTNQHSNIPNNHTKYIWNTIQAAGDGSRDNTLHHRPPKTPRHHTHQNIQHISHTTTTNHKLDANHNNTNHKPTTPKPRQKIGKKTPDTKKGTVFRPPFFFLTHTPLLLLPPYRVFFCWFPPPTAIPT